MLGRSHRHSPTEPNTGHSRGIALRPSSLLLPRREPAEAPGRRRPCLAQVPRMARAGWGVRLLAHGASPKVSRIQRARTSACSAEQCPLRARPPALSTTAIGSITLPTLNAGGFGDFANSFENSLALLIVSLRSSCVP